MAKQTLRKQMETSELLGIRGKTHGDFTLTAEISMGLKEWMEEQRSWKNLSPVQKEALHMIVHKIARILAGNADHKDHWDDISGYAKLVSDRL